MSVITNFFLGFSVLDDKPERLAEISKAITPCVNYETNGLVEKKVQGECCTYRVSNHPALLFGDYNYFDVERFLEELSRISWTYIECVYLILDGDSYEYPEIRRGRIDGTKISFEKWEETRS